MQVYKNYTHEQHCALPAKEENKSYFYSELCIIEAQGKEYIRKRQYYQQIKITIIITT